MAEQIEIPTYDIGGTMITIGDAQGSWTAESVVRDLQNDAYKLSQIPFHEGDVVIDIGAHVGTVSIYLAKKYPFLRIFAFEPIPMNYQNLIDNIYRNQVTSIIPHSVALTRDRRTLAMTLFPSNTGGATGQLANMVLDNHLRFSVPSITLDDVFAQNNITACKLLKMDCEGSEHEILMHAQSLDKVSYLSAEFHINDHLRQQGYSIERLVEHCAASVPREHITYISCEMHA